MKFWMSRKASDIPRSVSAVGVIIQFFYDEVKQIYANSFLAAGWKFAFNFGIFIMSSRMPFDAPIYIIAAPLY